MNKTITYSTTIVFLLLVGFILFAYINTLADVKDTDQKTEHNESDFNNNLSEQPDTDDATTIIEDNPEKDLEGMTQEEYNISCAEPYSEKIANEYKTSTEKVQRDDKEIEKTIKCGKNIDTMIYDIKDGHYDYFSFESGSESEFKIKNQQDIVTININGTTSILDKDNPSLLYHNKKGDVITIKTNSGNGVYYYINEFRDGVSGGYYLD